MELIERPNLRTVHYLNSISFDAFKDDCIDDAIAIGKPKPNIKDIQSWYSTLKQFCKTNIKTKGNTKRIYAYSMNTPTGLGGRLFCGNSMQGIWGVYRGALMNGIATDLDMQNAHPVILNYICKKHNIDCPNLEYYINHRDACLSKFPNKAIGKTAYLVATNNDKLSTKRSLPDHFKQYDREMKRIQTELIKLPEYADLIETIPEYKLSDNYNGSAINRILCYYENMILQHAIHVINSKGLEIAILMFDGCMIYGNHYDDYGLLNDITDYVNTQMPGLNMKWTYKKCDTSLVIPDDFDETDYINAGDLRFVQDDDKASDLILNDLQGLLICSHRDGRIFYKHNHIWICDNDRITNYLLEFIIRSNICKLNDNKAYVPYAQNIKSARNIKDVLLIKVSSREYEFDIYDKLHSTTKGRIAFRDGVLDFQARRFYEWDEIDFEYYTPTMIHFEFGKYFNNPQHDVIDVIRKTIFDNLFGNMTDTALHFLSRAIAGHCEDKHFATYLGNRDCGKGVLYDALSNAFGSYIATFELNNILYERQRDTQETSRKLYWLLALEFVRLGVSQETPEDQHIKADGKMIKKMAGGGDTHVARRNFDRQDTHFKIDTTFMIFGNWYLNIDTADTNEHRIEFESVIQFLSEEGIEAKRKSGASDIALSAYRLADPSLKSKAVSDEWKLALIYLIYQSYKPTAVNIKSIRLTEVDDEDLSVRERILKLYEITLNPEDIIPVNMVSADLQVNKKKVKAELTSMGVIYKKCKTHGDYRDFWCYYGLKVIQPINTVDCNE